MDHSYPDFLARLDEIQEDYCTTLASATALAKSLTLKFLCDGQGAVRRAILSL